MTLPPETIGVKPLVVRWEAMLTPTEDRRLQSRVSRPTASSACQLDGKDVTSAWQGHVDDPKLGRVHLEAGKSLPPASRLHARRNHSASGQARMVEG